MRYAIVQNGIVTNIIVLYPGNAGDFPNAIPLGDRPVAIGDTYLDGAFLRDGLPVLTPLEAAQAQLAAVDNAYVALEYDYALYELGMTE